MAASDQLSIQDQCKLLIDKMDQSYSSVNLLVSTLDSRKFINSKTPLAEEDMNGVDAVLDKLGTYKSKIQQLEQDLTLTKAHLAGQIRDRRGRGTSNSRGDSGTYSISSQELRKEDSFNIHTQVTDSSESAGAGMTSKPVEHVDLEHSATSASIRLPTVPESRRQQDSDPEEEQTTLNIADGKDEEHSSA